MPVHFYELLILSQKLNRNYMLKEEIIENEEAIARTERTITHIHTHTRETPKIIFIQIVDPALF